MIEHDFALEAVLEGPEAMIGFLELHGVDWKAAVGSYASQVTKNLCAERALTRAVIKYVLHGDAFVGCEFDGDSWHSHHVICRLDASRRPGGAAKSTEEVPA